MSQKSTHAKPANSNQTPLALTMGDPAGIGPDITLSAWLERNKPLDERRHKRPFVAIADPATLEERAGSLKLKVPIRPVTSPKGGADVFDDALPVLPIALDAAARPGHPDPANAAAIVRSIELAVIAVMSGQAEAVVTNPIAKHVLHDAGFAHPGHTEFLAELARKHDPRASATPVMLLSARELRVVPLTIHIPLAAVPETITPALILSTIRILHQAMISDFGIPRPRIAIAGLNPHAGENGSIGHEEREIISPAIGTATSEGFQVSGPHSADTLFHEAARSTYDAVIAMYHDQALIPIKTLAFDRGVNTTLGLPFIRTSPDHGTAFSIAGTGKARALSLREALYQAEMMVCARQRNAKPRLQ